MLSSVGWRIWITALPRAILIPVTSSATQLLTLFNSILLTDTRYLCKWIFYKHMETWKCLSTYRERKKISCPGEKFSGFIWTVLDKAASRWGQSWALSVNIYINIRFEELICVENCRAATHSHKKVCSRYLQASYVSRILVQKKNTWLKAANWYCTGLKCKNGCKFFGIKNSKIAKL